MEMNSLLFIGTTRLSDVNKGTMLRFSCFLIMIILAKIEAELKTFIFREQIGVVSASSSFMCTMIFRKSEIG